MKKTKVELTNMVEVAYFPKDGKHDATTTLLTAMIHVPEESLLPMNEEDKKYGGRLLDVYFDKAVEILKNEIGPINIYNGGFRFRGNITVMY